LTHDIKARWTSFDKDGLAGLVNELRKASNNNPSVFSPVSH